MIVVQQNILDIVKYCKSHRTRCNVFLDLDNTLISSVSYQEINKHVRNNTTLKYHTYDNQYIIFERPYLQQFLDFLFSNFNVSVWSAATKDYVMFIVNNIICTKPNRHIKMILHSDHCEMSRSINAHTPKDLRFVFYKISDYSPYNTFIIDDLLPVYSAQPNNCISIPAFDIDKPDTNDSALKNIIIELKQVMS